MSEPSNTSSKLGHQAVGNKTNQTPATAFQGSTEGNPTSIQGASNPATGGNKTIPDGPAQEIAGTLPQDFSLKGMKAEYKGEDKVVDNPLKDESVSAATGTGGDKVHRGLQSHEFDIPETYDSSRPRENTGENQRFGNRKP